MWLHQKHTLGAAAGLVLAAAGYALTSAMIATGEAPTDQYQPRATNETEEQLVFVYAFSSACGACNDPELPQIIEETKVLLVGLAERANFSMHAIAISSDLPVDDAIKYLRNYGEFDEVAVGGGWRNLGFLRYVWERHAGVAEVPQVIVLRRRAIGGPTPVFGVQDERVVARLVGKGEILRWIEAGLPMAE